jgi:type IV pilus assembly protein PilZ
MPEERPSDRRRAPRAPIELKVEYKRLNSFFADYTRNISRGGTFIRTQKPLDIGTEFMFQLYIPTLPDPLELRGRVQWVVRPDATPGDDEQDPGMGIGFVYGSEADRHRIEAIVERLMVDSLGTQISERLLKKRDDL